MNIPQDLKYTPDHEWLKVDTDGFAYVGITEHAQAELGDVVFVDVQSEGEKLDKEEAFGTIEAVKTVSDVFMPIAGEVVEFNALLEETPSLINSDSYADGWIIKIKISDTAQIEELLTPEAYLEAIGA